MSEAKRDFYGDLVGPDRQPEQPRRAGSEVAKLVEEIDRCLEASIKNYEHLNGEAARKCAGAGREKIKELEAALRQEGQAKMEIAYPAHRHPAAQATAPPEQAAPSWAERHGLTVNKPDLPQPASAGALSAIKEKIHWYVGSDSMSDCWAEILPLLAAHDQASAGALNAEPVTPKMMSKVFAKSINNTDPEHPHLYDHRIAAAELNRLLAAHDQKVREGMLDLLRKCPEWATPKANWLKAALASRTEEKETSHGKT